MHEGVGRFGFSPGARQGSGTRISLRPESLTRQLGIAGLGIEASSRVLGPGRAQRFE